MNDRKKEIAAWCAFQSDETLSALIVKFRQLGMCVGETEQFILYAAENEWKDRHCLSNWKELVKEFEVDTLQSAEDVDKELAVYVFSKEKPKGGAE